MNFASDYTFGIIFILTIVSIFLYKEITKDKHAVTAKYINNLELENKHYSNEDILQAMKASKFKNVYYDEDNQVFKAKVGFSMSSFYELIEIRLIETEGKQNLNFFSICGLPTQIYDWGKNERNYKRFIKNLHKKSNS